MKGKPYLENFFYNLPRFIIFIFIVTVVVVLFSKFSKYNTIDNFSKKISPPLNKTTAPTKETKKKISFDLYGPLICKGKTGKVNLELYLKNKKVVVFKKEAGKTEIFLYRQDCLYHWEKQKKIGLKTCGLEKYLTLFESFSKLGIINKSTIFQLLKNKEIFSSLSLSEKNIEKGLNSCKKENIKDESIFIIPKRILFKKNAKATT